MADKDKALNDTAGEETSPDAAPAEEPKTTEEVSKAEPTGEAEESETGESPLKKPKFGKGENERIRELNWKAKQAEERAKSLEERMAEMTKPAEPKPGYPGGEYQPPQYQPQAEPGAEITAEQYKQDVIRTADNLIQLRIGQEKVIQNINKEAGDAVRAYPQLDPDSDQFDKDLSESVTEASLAYARTNPNQSLKKFVDKMMQPYKKAVTKEVGQASENIAKQVSQAGQRPTGVSAKGEKDDKELSVEELEKKYGVVY